MFAGAAFPDTGFAFLKNWDGHLFREFLTSVHCPISPQPTCISLSSGCEPGGSQRALHWGEGGGVGLRGQGQGEGIPWEGSECGGRRSGMEGNLPSSWKRGARRRGGAGVRVDHGRRVWRERESGDLAPDSKPCPGFRFQDRACSRAISGYISEHKRSTHEATLTQEMTEAISQQGKGTRLQKKPRGRPWLLGPCSCRCGRLPAASSEEDGLSPPRAT